MRIRMMYRKKYVMRIFAEFVETFFKKPLDKQEKMCYND